MTNITAGACLLVGLLGACAPAPSVELDGAVAYNTSGVPGSWSTLQLAINGSASLHVAREAGSSQDFTGNASAAALTALRDDIATADLGSLSSEYRCTDLVCDAPEPPRTLVVEVGGVTTTISVEGRISNAQLPEGLVTVFRDLEATAKQLSSSTGS